MNFQLGSTLLDACVLALLTKEDAYGYYLTQSLAEIIDISESTLYPVLRRLQRDACLEAYDMEHQGRNRRYYRITGTGVQRYRDYLFEWNKFKERVDTVLGGTMNG